MIHIVLYHPEIPANTGNIARLCFGNAMHLHLIEPLGFQLDEKKLLRAGLDFWPKLQLFIHADWAQFVEAHPLAKEKHAFFFSSKAQKSFWEIEYPDPVYLVFGSESWGFEEAFQSQIGDRAVCIPMSNPEGRCLNLSNAVAASAYEVMRQIGLRSRPS